MLPLLGFEMLFDGHCIDRLIFLHTIMKKTKLSSKLDTNIDVLHASLCSLICVEIKDYIDTPTIAIGFSSMYGVHNSISIKKI